MRQESRSLTMVPSVFAGRYNIQLDQMPLAKEIEAYGGVNGYVRAMRRLAAMDGKPFTVPAAVADLLNGAGPIATAAADLARATSGSPREAALACRHVAPLGRGNKNWVKLWCSWCMCMQDVTGIYEKGMAPLPG